MRIRAELQINKNQMIIFITTIACIIFFLMPQAWCTEYSSLIPPDKRISDTQASHMLALLLSQNDKDIIEALAIYQTLIKEMPADKTLRIEFAELLARTGKPDEARKELEPILKKEPGNYMALSALGRIHLYSKDYSRAIEMFEDLRSRNKSTPKDLMDLARAYNWSRDYQKAIKVYNDILLSTEVPGSDLYTETGDVYLYSGDLDKASEYYRSAYLLNKESTVIRKKLALVLSWTGQDNEALPMLKALYDNNPEDLETGKELLRVYIREGRDRDALLLAKNIIQISPSDIDIIIDLANMEARLGHAENCRSLYQKALILSGNSDKIMLAFADQMNMWGDFNTAEHIYMDILAKLPDDSIRLKLAKVLSSSQRYEEADYQYRLMLRKPENRVNMLLCLAELRFQEKNYNEVLTYLDQIPGITDEKDFSQITKNGLILKAKSLDMLKKYDESGRLYSMLTSTPGVTNTGFLIEAGKSRLKSGDTKQAKYFFEKAFKTDPEDIPTLYYITGEKKVITPGFIQSICSKGKYTPMELLTWAELLTGDGFHSEAITILETAHIEDPACFPVTMRLAELLAVDHQYGRAIELFENLERKFPENYKIMISHARVLGWSGEYEHSILVYSELQKTNPDNPVLLREKARTAAWGRMMKKASGIYAESWKTSVDKRLLSKLKSESVLKDAEIPGQLENNFDFHQDGGSIYSAYEFLRDGLENRSFNLTGPQTEKANEILLDLLPAYKIQKASYLESSSKYYAWDNRFLHALERYKELVAFQPGNEEAAFDYAQVYCSLNMCNKEAEIYRDLLDMDPFHSLAAEALKRNTMRSHPSLSYNYSYWDEEGRGILSGISRDRHDLKLDLPLWYRYIFRFAAHRWIEKPYFDSETYRADGYSANFDGVFTPYLKGAIGWTHKDYKAGYIEDTDTGFLNIWLSFYDYFNLGMGFDKNDELSNNFAIKQKIQSDQWWVSVNSDLTHNLDIDITARKLQYNDSNEGYYHSMAIGYSFSEYPRIFKVILTGEYRDTANQNNYIYDSGNSLINIIHPYWTPDGYTSAGITLEWYHEISKLLFCGNEKHFYDLRFSFGPDSNSDFPLQIEAEYNYDFLDHWTLSFKGYFHRSDEWDAEGVWSTIQYRF